MASDKNVMEFQIVEEETYTFVSSLTLRPEFPETVMRQEPLTPLRLRSPKEIERLKKHPFFKDAEQR
jgi:hypothetical protein